jgi:hypothetical protein
VFMDAYRDEVVGVFDFSCAASQAFEPYFDSVAVQGFIQDGVTFYGVEGGSSTTAPPPGAERGFPVHNAAWLPVVPFCDAVPGALPALRLPTQTMA